MGSLQELCFLTEGLFGTPLALKNLAASTRSKHDVYILCAYIHIYIYIYIISLSLYTYIYIYIYTHIYRREKRASRRPAHGVQGKMLHDIYIYIYISITFIIIHNVHLHIYIYIHI